MKTTAGGAREFRVWAGRITGTEAPKRVKQLHAAIHGQLIDGLIFDTPVGDPSKWESLRRADGSFRPPPPGYVGGRARGGWETTLGTVPAEETGNIDPGGGATQAANHAALMGLMPFGLTVIANLVPYIRRLNEGWSTQQPANFVERNLQSVRAQFGGGR